MTGRRHRSNCELVGQGIANIASGLFGGICVTGTIARTATNVRAGARGPVAGMMHALFLLLFVLIAAPVARFIPLACLAGVLAMVAWNMVEKHAFAMLLRASRADAAVLLATFLLTIFRDLTEAIVIGFALGSVLFIHRMSKTTAIETDTPFVSEDKADDAYGGRKPYDEAAASDPHVVIYRISGVFFFGAAASIGAVLDRISDTHRHLVIDFAAVPFLDSTAANTIEGLALRAKRRQVEVILTGTSREMRTELFAHGIKPPLVHYQQSIEEALSAVRAPAS
jgi:SulP family sulfate permease